MTILPRASWMLPSLLIAACGTAPPPADDAARDDTASSDTAVDAPAMFDAGADTAVQPGTDAANPVDVPVGTDAAACTLPDAGTLQTNYYCDLAIINVLRTTGAASTVVVTARVGGAAGCGAIDSVDVMHGATMLAHLGATPTVLLGTEDSVVATGPAPDALVAACGDEATRLTAYGLVIRGRDAHGPFQAGCGSSESGSRWPPGTSLACHTGLAQPPPQATSETILRSSSRGSVSDHAYLLHAAGAPAATSVDSTVRIVSPQYAPFGGGMMLMSHDTTGWTGMTSETTYRTTPATQISLFQTGTPPAFDTTLCPVPSMPGPGAMLPPFFLARITGQGPAGPFETELLTSCMTEGP